MNILRDGKTHEVFLGDDGTLDTVIIVDGHTHTFSQERAAACRKRNGEMTKRGLRELAIEALDDPQFSDVEIDKLTGAEWTAPEAGS